METFNIGDLLLSKNSRIWLPEYKNKLAIVTLSRKDSFNAKFLFNGTEDKYVIGDFIKIGNINLTNKLLQLVL